MSKHFGSEGPLEKRRAAMEAAWEDDRPDAAERERWDAAVAEYQREIAARPLGSLPARKAA